MKPLYILVALLFVGVAACSTSIKRTGAPSKVISHGVTVTAISATLASPSFPADVKSLLEAEVKKALALHKAGPTSVSLKLTVTAFHVPTEQERAAGVFAGSNVMEVHVDVLDSTGATVDSFSVKRSANPGGYGMFYDQKAATIKATAEGIADGLYKK